jgi:hypothetical protein
VGSGANRRATYDKKQTAASNTKIELTETKEGTGMMVYRATTKKTFSNAF